jgi:hypothetical protein
MRSNIGLAVVMGVGDGVAILLAEHASGSTARGEPNEIAHEAVAFETVAGLGEVITLLANALRRAQPHEVAIFAADESGEGDGDAADQQRADDAKPGAALEQVGKPERGIDDDDAGDQRRQGNGKRDAPAHAPAARSRKRRRLHRHRQGRRRLDDRARDRRRGAARQDARLDASLAVHQKRSPIRNCSALSR